MEDESAILKAVIEKAMKNGWRDRSWEDTPENIGGYAHWLIFRRRVESVIFSFEFAKALWGEKGKQTGWKYYLEGQWYDDYSMDEVSQDVLEEAGGWEEYRPIYENSEDWQYHLQQLAIAPNRIEYLKQFINE